MCKAGDNLNIDKIRFGKILRELRIAKDMTQEQLAELIDKSPGAVGQYERGDIFPNYETLSKIIDAFEVDANLFFAKETSELASISNWMTNVIFGMTDSERVTIGNFLSEFARVMLKSTSSKEAPMKGAGKNENSDL